MNIETCYNPSMIFVKFLIQNEGGITRYPFTANLSRQTNVFLFWILEPDHKILYLNSDLYSVIFYHSCGVNYVAN